MNARVHDPAARDARRCLAIASDIDAVLRAAVGTRRPDVVVAPVAGEGYRAAAYAPDAGLTLVAVGETRLAALSELQVRVHDLRRALARAPGAADARPTTHTRLVARPARPESPPARRHA